MKPLKDKVIIRKGFAAYFGIIFELTAFVGTTYSLIGALITGEFLKPSNFWLMLMLIFIAAITGSLLYYYLPQNYVVSLEGIQIGTWRGYVFIPWQNVTQIVTLPSRNIQPDLALIVKEKDTTKQIGLGLPLLAFHKYSALAIIEAATVSNPSIELKFEHANDFGKPPYGIFVKK